MSKIEGALHNDGKCKCNSSSSNSNDQHNKQGLQYVVVPVRRQRGTARLCLQLLLRASIFTFGMIGIIMAVMRVPVPAPVPAPVQTGDAPLATRSTMMPFSLSWPSQFVVAVTPGPTAMYRENGLRDSSNNIDPAQDFGDDHHDDRGYRHHSRLGAVGKKPPLNHTASPTTAACIMYKNDDRNLREWIAYHYHVVNLRHLMVRVDPTTTSQPDAILDRWRGYIHIDVWRNDTFVTPEDLENVQEQMQWYAEPTRQKSIQKLIQIHDIFVNRCLKHMKKRNLGWTLIIDNDEYLRINYESVEKWSRNHPTSKVQLTQPPPISEPGSVMTFLQQELNKPDPATKPKGLIDSACVQFPRSRYGSVESSRSQRQNLVPKGFDAKQFNTMQFRYHAQPDRDLEGNTWGKAMVDLHRINTAALQDMGNMHMPVYHECTWERMRYTRQQDSVLLVNHYLGPATDFFSRNDDRRIMDQQYRDQATVRDGSNDEIRPWLEGFVKWHGIEAAKLLLNP